MPIILVIHGTVDTIFVIRSGIGQDLEPLADEHGFIIAYAEGYEHNRNECRTASWRQAGQRGQCRRSPTDA